ncbi:glycosyltransferase family 8 protein [Candidatus Methylopumilus turicensis]|uniref:Glycosyl transferase, family 8 n=1 Tax=Candidatus Methylopumilus turicensis TaxID=1581680 RepID=A0A0B7IUQ6_9PROT|nr:glycosyltransferase family 8 protein [Candidatus Methylopumilus turicensis]CEN55999.1 Glycosyl transferase, family 8 [Candidatus Methylopumilus turicensis]
MEKYNIVFASDRGYLPHLSVALASLIDSNSEVTLNIYIINTDIKSDEWLNLIGLDTQRRHTFFNAQINDNELVDLVTNYHFTKANYYRLFIDDIVPFDKALYIDSDVLVNGSLAGLWNTNVDDFYLAAVEEPGFFTRHNDLEMDLNAKYFNSGVMLLNLNAWRKNEVRKRVLEFVRRKPEAIQYVDQCGLNSIVNGNWLSVSPKYNMQNAILDMEKHARNAHYDFDDIDYAVTSPVVIHFTGSSKPWHLLNKHPFKKKYWNYLRQTTYKRFIPTDFTIKKFLIWCIPNQYRNNIINFFKKIN